MKQFVNLHAHSMGSLLDGMSKAEEYAERARELGQPAVCSTDHGNVHMLLDFYDAAEKVGLKYLPGIEAYCARKTRYDRDAEELSGRSTSEWDQRGPYHIGLIAYNNAGYHNLIKLSSRAYLEGYFGKARVDHELIEQHHDGIVMLSGCLSGEIQQAILRGDLKHAYATAQKMQDIFGKENYFIEIQNHGIPEELETHPHLIEIAKHIGAPIVPTCDSHYTHKHQAHAHDSLLCINTKSTLADENRFRFSSDEFYLKSFDEMASIFPEEWVKNTLLVYEKHDLKLSFDEHHYPAFETPDSMGPAEYLEKLTFEGAARRFGPDWAQKRQISDRIKYELEVINDMGFPNYFLVVADIINWCKDNDILVGFGRGSVSGSLVAYCLRITEVNPLQWGLIFERFLVPGRNSPPDIDIDIDDRHRGRVVEYTRRKYGYDHTAQIGTFGTIRAKKAVRDAARVLGHDFALGDKIAKAMPPPVFGVPKTLEQCMQSDEFVRLYKEDVEAKEVIDAARHLEGLIREVGVHAAGLVVADKPITEYVPVSRKGEGEPIVTQWEMKRIDQLGLLKIDFLGLRNLAIVDIAVKDIRRRTGKVYNPYEIPDTQDEEVYEALSKGDNVGAFQIESEGLKELLIGMKPSEQMDLSAALALYRPGPMASNVHNEYVERKHGRKPVTFLHESLRDILGNTYGLLLYQEQLLLIAQKVAGFSISDADYLRKAVGKKKPEEMKKWREQFVQGCMDTAGFDFNLATRLFDEIEHHASYSFSINHSLAYSLLTYVTAFLKVKNGTEFMSAALNTVQDEEDRLRLYLNESNRMGITVSPPSINYSNRNFKVVSDNEILYGFSGIKGLGDSYIASIVEGRGDSVYTSFYDFTRKTYPEVLNKTVMEHLFKAGCFDELPLTSSHSYPEIDRRQRIEILQVEANELGVYLTEHPMADVQDLIHDKITHQIKEVSDTHSGVPVTVGGIVSQFEKKVTKTGKKMYKLKLEDLSSSITIDVFPKQAPLVEESGLAKGDIIVLYGRTKKQSDEDMSTVSINYFRHEKIETDELSGGKPITIVFEKPPSYDQLNKMSDIIDHNEGNSTVFLMFNNEDGKLVRMKFKRTTSYSMKELLTQLIGVTQ